MLKLWDKIEIIWCYVFANISSIETQDKGNRCIVLSNQPQNPNPPGFPMGILTMGQSPQSLFHTITSHYVFYPLGQPGGLWQTSSGWKTPWPCISQSICLCHPIPSAFPAISLCVGSTRASPNPWTFPILYFIPLKYLDYAYTVNQITLWKTSLQLERLFLHRHDPLIPSPHYSPLNPDRGPQNIASYIIGR